MKRPKSSICILAALFSTSLLLAGCPARDSNPIPPSGTRVSTTSQPEVFRRTARDLEEHCQMIGGCTCILDGIQTTCAVVFACLDAGFCELARE